MADSLPYDETTLRRLKQVIAAALALILLLVGLSLTPVSASWHVTIFLGGAALVITLGWGMMRLIRGMETRVRRSHDALERIQQGLRRAHEIARMGTWDWDLVTDLFQGEGEVQRILGLAPETPVPFSRFLDAVPNSDRERVHRLVRQAVDWGGHYTIVHPMIRPDGTRRFVHVHGEILRNTQGKADRMVGTLQDVTEQHLAMEREGRATQSRIAISALLETGLERLTLKRQLEVALEIILTVPWLSVEYKGSIFLTDAATSEQVMAVQRGLHPELLVKCARVPLGYCLCGRAAQSKELVFVNHLDHRHDITFEGIQDHGHFCVPLLYQKQLIGILNLYVPYNFERRAEEEAFLTTIANTLAGLILFRQTERRLEEERVFIRTILSTAAALVVVMDPDGRIVLFNQACRAMTGYGEEEVREKVMWEALLAHEEREETQAFFAGVIREKAAQERENRWVGKGGDQRLVLWTHTPILTPEGEVKHVVAAGIDITEQRAAEEQLRHLAGHDPLTRLPNRRLFIEHLQLELRHAQRDRALLGVLFLDLDRFKQVNDTLGHEVGDLLLIDVAARIRLCLRQSDVVARLGGDEFTVILTAIHGREDACGIAGKIIEQLSQPFPIQGHLCHIGVSIGIALFPDHAEDPEELLKRADAAMYVVKARGRNAYEVCAEGAPVSV